LSSLRSLIFIQDACVVPVLLKASDAISPVETVRGETGVAGADSGGKTTAAVPTAAADPQSETKAPSGTQAEQQYTLPSEVGGMHLSSLISQFVPHQPPPALLEAQQPCMRLL
jgi:hypothetical protein